jgi:hypothetical protein
MGSLRVRILQGRRGKAVPEQCEERKGTNNAYKHHKIFQKRKRGQRRERCSTLCNLLSITIICFAIMMRYRTRCVRVFEITNALIIMCLDRHFMPCFYALRPTRSDASIGPPAMIYTLVDSLTSSLMETYWLRHDTEAKRASWWLSIKITKR